MDVDYRMPLQLNGIVIKQVPTATGVQVKIINCKSAIQWKDIIAIEQFIETWLVPDDDRPKVVIQTSKMMYILIAEFEEILGDWTGYKLWAEKRSVLFKLN